MSEVIDAFLAQYYARNPVNATFTGVHDHDARLPDWSREGREEDARELHRLRDQIDERHPLPIGVNSTTALRGDGTLLDAQLACANIEVRTAELESGFMHDRNPALWTGEAIFGAVSLMLRPFTPRQQRLEPLAQRLTAIAPFLATMRATLAPSAPERWIARAQRECRAAISLFGPGLDAWLALEPAEHASLERVRAAAARARAAFHACDEWLATLSPAPETDCAAGGALFDVLLRRGHFCLHRPDELLREAQDALQVQKAGLDLCVREAESAGSTLDQVLADDHPSAEEYYAEFMKVWGACRAFSLERDLVTWPEWPLRYVPIPPWARSAAPQLYWLFYRSPAPFDPYTTHDYLVTPIEPDMPEAERTRRLRATNHSVIKLNHVVHHGALGHHVQNWHATHRSRTRIGTIAAVDCASRIGMFLGGSMAEGWACYATELMDEQGFLSPLEQVAQLQSRARMLARAIVDISLHHGALTLGDAARFYVDAAHMSPEAADAEVTKNTMFPCTALMYWLGTQGILDLRATLQRQRGSSFCLKAFHDELLSYGSIPVPLVARLMNREIR